MISGTNQYSFQQHLNAFLAKVDDLKQLVKFNLTLFVVLSSVVGYLLALKGPFIWYQLVFLVLGGFFITGAANTLNQILEREYDALMVRTARRPLPAGRMEVTEAILWAGVMGVSGILLLAMFNLFTALLGAASLIIYAFIYTPLKRITPLSVAVGAIPGALPAVIGCIALEGKLTLLSITLFGIQFFWQFPHFWSIGWLGFDEYKKAGFNIMPLPSKERDPSIGMYSMLYALFLIPISLMFVLSPDVSVWAIAGLCFGALGFSYAGWGLFKFNDQVHARRLLFASLIYLPFIQIILLIDKWL
ncbi:MAG: heme o synthase [Saprospiraceae bacterium]|jgi:protoheme IX farnesyltransferase|nr:protoheme IX farnesyltransferase [Saprospiraceae bacterium]MBP7801817.1 heme o synthase [Saprospiraceae bacterium]MBP7923711.1 heme o synthase [Saprospiraceae bacterium]